MVISPQSQFLYQTLLESAAPLSAKELAKKLGIFPNTVYRLTRGLTDLGLIAKTGECPLQFVAKPLNEGLSLFLLHQNDWFSQQFSAFQQEKSFSKSSPIKLFFIQGRDELMRLSEGEIKKAAKSVDLLRSGHEIPAEVMLALTEAKRRKVTTRMLIQDYSSDNAEQVANWQKNGVLVRKTGLCHLRLMLYDSQIVYFMSYKHFNSNDDLGVKIEYPPLAVIFSQLFDQWWEKATSI